MTVASREEVQAARTLRERGFSVSPHPRIRGAVLVTAKGCADRTVLLSEVDRFLGNRAWRYDAPVRPEFGTNADEYSCR